MVGSSHWASIMINNTECARNSIVFSHSVEQVMRQYGKNSEFGRENSQLSVKKSECN